MLLELRDISSHGLVVRREVAKTGRKRVIPFVGDQQFQVSYFLKHRLLLETDSPWVFVNDRGGSYVLTRTLGIIGLNA